jgi:hypothetical protein
MYSKTYIYIVYQNLDLYRIPIPRFISYYNAYKKLNLYGIPQPRFIQYNKT